MLNHSPNQNLINPKKKKTNEIQLKVRILTDIANIFRGTTMEKV